MVRKKRKRRRTKKNTEHWNSKKKIYSLQELELAKGSADCKGTRLVREIFFRI